MGIVLLLFYKLGNQMSKKSFKEYILEKAAANIKHIVLPEGEDQRTIDAAKIICEAKIADITLLGDVEKISSALASVGADANKIKIIDPLKSEKLPVYAEQFFKLRKHKGVTQEQALDIVKGGIYFGTMMIYCGDCDGLVAGAVGSTADTVRPALQIVKSAAGVKTVSSVFFMSKGEDTYLFADCGLVEFPTKEQLIDIIVSTAKSALQFDITPKIACLSYSTKGSANREETLKMAKVADLARTKLDEIYGKGKVLIDGELQFDAAFVPTVAAKKAPDSPIKGEANVFIFPDLQAGNICYKVTERLGGFDAYGPILQGLGKPVNDLSRGCCADDIAGAVAITAIQAIS